MGGVNALGRTFDVEMNIVKRCGWIGACVRSAVLGCVPERERRCVWRDPSSITEENNQHFLMFRSLLDFSQCDDAGDAEVIQVHTDALDTGTRI